MNANLLSQAGIKHMNQNRIDKSILDNEPRKWRPKAPSFPSDEEDNPVYTRRKFKNADGHHELLLPHLDQVIEAVTKAYNKRLEQKDVKEPTK
jgi:hypothetical protein